MYSKSAERKHILDKKRIETAPKRSNQLEAERRKEGLEKPLDETNKGFKMLQKMGLSSSTSAAAEKLRAAVPIVAEIRKGRTGLGTEALIKEKLDMKLNEMRAQAHASEDCYLKTVREKIVSSQGLRDLFRSQRCCYQLDVENTIKEPNHRWFWPKATREPLEGCLQEDFEDPEENLEHEDTDKKLCEITEYLRLKYLYCIWCGIKYDSMEDIEVSCPGDSKEMHDE